MFKYIGVFYQALIVFGKEEILYYSAAFSYYAPLALVPFIFFSLSIVGIFYGESFTGATFASWGSALGEDLVSVIQKAVDNLNRETLGAGAPFLSGFLSLGFYVVAVNTLSDGFARLWGVKRSGFIAWLTKSTRSVVFLLFLQIYLILVIALEFYITPLLFTDSAFVPNLFLLFSTLFFFLITFRYLVKPSPSWRGCVLGATVTALLFSLIKSLVDLYVITTPVFAFYGTAGLILILLAWIYVMVSIVFYGSAVAGIYDKMVLNKQ